MHDGPDKATAMWREAARLPCAAARPLIGLSDPERLPDHARALRATPRGGILLLRPAAPLPLEVLRSLLRQAHGRNIRLIISVVKRAGHVQLADARHLPQSLLYRPYKENKPLTAAVHSQAAIMSAARSGASCLLISPVFATKSHPDGKPLGVVRLAALTRLAGSLGLRVYALGGITRAAHIRRLRDTGISGIAGITLLQA
ncbi:MAG: thiamine phosphate synthase [Parvibaculum sp.]